MKGFPLTNYVAVSLYQIQRKKSILSILPEVFDYFDYKTADLNQPVFQDEYFRRSSCSLLLLSLENSCQICEKENIKFKKKVNSKKASLAKPANLNGPVKFTSPGRIRLTLQQKRLQCIVGRTNISNEKNFGH